MRPIDADELEKALENYSNNHGLINDFVEFLNVVDEVHTLDVKPVVHGNWVGIDEFPHETWECSACGRIVIDEYIDDYNFCPQCGADMRKE